MADYGWYIITRLLTSVQVTVQGNGEPPPPDGRPALELTCLNCLTTAAPGQVMRPQVRAVVNSGQLQGVDLRGDMLRHKSGQRFGAYEFVAVPGRTVINAGQSHVFEFYEADPMRAPEAPGRYDSIWQVWRSGDWAGPEINLGFQVTASGGSNRPPRAPNLTGPGDWAVYTGNSGICQRQ